MIKNVKIKQFREHCKLSQEELGQHIGVTRQTIASWESGETVPELIHLFKIASTLQIPVRLLIEDEEVQKKSKLLFRADDMTRLSVEIRKIINHKAQEYSSLEHLLGEFPGLPESRPLEANDKNIIEQTAISFRSWLGLGNLSCVYDLFMLLENQGIKIILYDLPEELSGFSCFTNDLGGFIVINKNHPIERQYFTAIHEMGHLIFHRSHYDPTAVVKGKVPAHFESAVNLFAGKVLFPDNLVNLELHSYRDKWIPLPVLIDIKQRHFVSIQTILIRANQVGILSQKTFNAQFGSFKKKFDKEEPGTLKKEQTGLTRLERLTYRALVEEKITISKAKEILGKPLSEIKKELVSWMDQG